MAGKLAYSLRPEVQQSNNREETTSTKIVVEDFTREDLLAAYDRLVNDFASVNVTLAGKTK